MSLRPSPRRRRSLNPLPGGVTFIADHPLLFSALVRRWLFRAEEAQNVSTDLTGSIKGGENAKHEVGINLMLCNVYVDDTI